MTDLKVEVTEQLQFGENTMIERLSFGEPFIESYYIKEEAEYTTPGHCILVNLDTEQPIGMEGGFALPPMKAIRTCKAKISVPGKALLVCNAGTINLTDLQTLDVLRKVWKSNWELTHLEQHRGQPYYKSPQVTFDNVTMNFCLVSEPDAPSGIHREHGGPVRELHVQMVGEGAVDLMRSEDQGSMYASLSLTAGSTHMPTWNAQGEYPWHRYRSKTRCIFLAVTIR